MTALDTSTKVAELRLDGVCAGYGMITAIRDVSLDVFPGEVTALLGRNGAGKSTTLRSIAGLTNQSAGRIAYQGRDLGGIPPHERCRAGIGLVQEGQQVFRSRTVEENLLLGHWPHSMRKTQARDSIAQVYERFPILADRRTVRAGVLSGGQQKMLAIAQALVGRPRVLMLDEPSAGLAPRVVDEVLAIVRTLREEGVGVLLVEQSVEASLEVADRVVTLDGGRVRVVGPADEPGIRARIRRAYFSSTQESR